MPVHDWSRVEANLFHDFHQTWTVGICNSLNDRKLPARFSALIERHEPDMEQRRIDRRNMVEQRLARRANRVAIRHSLGRVVCILEIVSPGNKSSKAALARFVDKTTEFLRAGVHVLVVDLFPSVRDPNGIHEAIWDAVGNGPFELPADNRLILASYVAAPPTAYVYPLGVGDTLPDIPAWLDADSYVPVPLESTYESTWTSCPPDMREVVLHGRLPDEETDSPIQEEPR